MMLLALYSFMAIAAPPDAGAACMPNRATREALRTVHEASVKSGSTWRCVLGRGDSIEVVARIVQSPDEEDVHEWLELRRVRDRQPFQRLPVDVGWGFAILAKNGEGIRAIDIDGDGFRDLLIESQMGRGTNRASTVYLYDPRTSMLYKDDKLSQLMNVRPSRPGCVRHSISNEPGPDDFIEGEYCGSEGEWIEMSRVESTVDVPTRRRIRRHYLRKGDAMVLIRADTVRSRSVP